ncbi:bifunctional hydroxymethylpyrimidine kinase/phosphomethylpyrimidine kinase [Oxalobacter vibrioformis]|uniref:hydroxymethylpyrimidine kinase n=1 Tax=Oxalobacter vibrioformis TaxID=933080 RepID=A0A9E9P3S8_9BURK|nr:bifunctional hydroxymethylpyrimidine kinase/phosphomethylpyrimidine kinase [Oxalobacter vibrioformis]WAW10560.1 bifunctional hydroxymethylpyrimidine kinase/phosphomethylpyrimidine kinase [Oxalobacter vibrioformis]
MIANVFSIAGTDPTGGAGIQADLKTFSAMGTYAMAAITAVVAQNTSGVRAFQPLDPGFVADQIDAVFDDVRVDVVKIGMVATADIAKAIADRLTKHKPACIVLDPVMVAKSGDLLLQPDAVEAMRDILTPMATVITPNLPEAGVLLGREMPKSREEMYAILPDLLALGSQWVLLKGGHLPGENILDILYGEKESIDIDGPRIDTNNLHGTGCTLSAALSALLTRYDMPESAKRARAYLTEALIHSSELSVGKGKGPVHHFYDLWNTSG